jgi:hypothetical protein
VDGACRYPPSPVYLCKVFYRWKLGGDFMFWLFRWCAGRMKLGADLEELLSSETVLRDGPATRHFELYTASHGAPDGRN